MLNREHDLAWFAVQVWTQHEHRVNQSLSQKHIDTFLPTKRVLRQWCDRTQWSEVPLFPGYVFARFSAESKLPVVVTPKVRGIVGFGRVPEPIRESEIESIKTIMKSGVPVQSCSELALGAPVEIMSGPLAGVSGILIEKRSVLRLVVAIELINRSVSVEVTPAMLASRKSTTGRLVNEDRRCIGG
jgi:transcription antitermination factor NusG